MKPPPSQSSNITHQQTPQMLRESREKERHQHLASVSKQIVSPEPIHNSASIPNSRQGGYGSNIKSNVGIGLPPSGSPLKKKLSKANLSNRQEEEVLARVRAPINIPKQPIKP